MSKSLKLIIEALLFSSEKPLTVKDIKECIPDTDAKDIKNALTILEHDYDAMDRSFDLKEVAGGYQFRSKQEYGSYILRMLQSTPNRLSRAAMETLAIVAYKQPILKHEIEKLRGVDVGGILKTLMEKDLVKIMGRKDLPGKPLIYGTTKRFLEVFDLKDISDLPKMNEIKEFGLAGYEPTPQNQENPPQPQGTEGLYNTIPIPYSTGDIPVLPQEQLVPAEMVQKGSAAQDEVSGHDEGPGDVEIQPGGVASEGAREDEGATIQPPLTDERQDNIEEGYQVDEPAGAPEYFGEEDQEDVSDDLPDEGEFFPEETSSQEDYSDMNGGYSPDNDLSEDGNEDDPED